MSYGAKLVQTINCTFSKILATDGRSLDFTFGINDGTNQLTPNGKIAFASGTGPGNVNAVFNLTGTTGAGATTEVNLHDGSVLDPGDAPIIFTKIKYLYLSIEAPGGTAIFGPQGLTNAVQLNFNGVTSSDKLPITNAHLVVDATGWTIDATHNILGINNPGGTSIKWTLVGAGER